MRKYIVKGLMAALIGVVGLLGVYTLVCAMSGSSVSDTVLFLWRFVEAPTSVGAVAPSSPALACALVAQVKPGDEQTANYFLEVGAGTGAVTQNLVALLGKADKLDVVELDSELAALLTERYKADARVQVHCCSIMHWCPPHKYNAIVIGVPFNALPFDLVQGIWQHVATLCLPGAPVSYFSYIGLAKIKKTLLNEEEQRDFESIQNFLRTLYKCYGVGKTKVWANVPPARVAYLCFK